MVEYKEISIFAFEISYNVAKVSNLSETTRIIGIKKRKDYERAV